MDLLRRNRMTSILIALVVAAIGVTGIIIGNAQTPGTPAGTDEVQTEEILVRYKPGADKQRFRSMATRARTSEKREIDGLRIKVMKVAKADKAQALTELAADPQVEFAEPSVKRHYHAVPNDTDYAKQRWIWQNIKAESGWDKTKGSSDVIIAIIDGGTNLTHPDLASKIVPGTDFGSGDNDPMDEDGHGSMTAGLAAAVTDNGAGVAGACWNCKIMPVKVFDGDSGTNEAIIDGIKWAADHGAQIINMSLGGPDSSMAEEAAVNYAVSKGALVVVAAGNDGVTTKDYPAAYESSIAVAANKADDLLTSYSQRGSWVDISAPGDAYSTSWPGIKYETMSGTSFSAPIVAGVLGLLKGAFPNATAAELRTAILSTADTCCDGKITGGRLNVDKAYASLAGSTNPNPTPNPTPNPNPTPGAADLNKDGRVNVADLSALLSAWGKSNVPADLDGSGKVDVADLSQLLTTWTR